MIACASVMLADSWLAMVAVQDVTHTVNHLSFGPFLSETGACPSRGVSFVISAAVLTGKS